MTLLGVATEPCPDEPFLQVHRWLGVLLLLVMALARSVWSVKAVILPLYLARTACANCTSALARSILMDFVSKVRRRTVALLASSHI